jgi:hypothetical protein
MGHPAGTHAPFTGPWELTVDMIRDEAEEVYGIDLCLYGDEEIQAAIDRTPIAGAWSLDGWEDFDGRKRLAVEWVIGREL